ncbi:MAG: DUF4824 family protein [Desulfuromusa sp.]|nr:DUF4824 family protein [Desulfuromusa sp.]
MKFLLSQRGLFLLGFLLLLLVNSLVLGGVMANRTGTPETQIILTERELQLPYRHHAENSGLSLRLMWRVPGAENTSYRWDSPTWFDIAKLEELGFSIPEAKSGEESYRERKRSLEKEGFIVLENDSPLFLKVIRALEQTLEKEQQRLQLDSEDQELQARVKEATTRLQHERVAGSRLFAVNAGLNAEKLRELYNNRSRFFLVKGIVNYRYSYTGEGAERKQQIGGYISSLSNKNIHVPRQYRHKFDQITAAESSKSKDNESPRYQVELASGSRFEPWLVAVKKIADN